MVKDVDLVRKVRMLFVEIIRCAVKDVKRDPNGETRNGTEAYDWFWSQDFDLWCERVGWDNSNYLLLRVKRKVKKIRETALKQERKFQNG